MTRDTLAGYDYVQELKLLIKRREAYLKSLNAAGDLKTMIYYAESAIACSDGINKLRTLLGLEGAGN